MAARKVKARRGLGITDLGIRDIARKGHIMNNKEFDKKVRELMEVHSEVPPIGSWDLIESALLQKKSAKMLYFRRALYTTVAVAASLVLLLVLNRNQVDSTDSIKVVEQNGTIANLESESTVQESSLHEKPLQESSLHEKPLQESFLHEKPLQETSNNKHTPTGHVLNASTKEKVLIDVQELLEELVMVEEPVVANQQIEQAAKEIEVEKSIAPPKSKSQFAYPPIEDYKRISRKKNTPLMAFATNLTPSSGSNSVLLMAMSQAQGGLAANDVVSTIQKAYVPQEVISNTKFIMPVSVGVQFQMPISKLLSVGLGVNYTMLFSNYDALSRQETRQTQQTLHYIGVPLNLYTTFMQKDNIRLYAMGGVTLEKGLYAFYRVSENGIRRSRGEYIEGMQLSVTGGLGVELAVSNSTGLYFDPSIAYYFDNNQPVSIRTAQPLQFKFELGFRFHL